MHPHSGVHSSKISLNIFIEYLNVGRIMSAGLETRGKSLRIWMRPIATESVIKETLDWDFTPENQDRAEKLANLIKLEIQL